MELDPTVIHARLQKLDEYQRSLRRFPGTIRLIDADDVVRVGGA